MKNQTQIDTDKEEAQAHYASICDTLERLNKARELNDDDGIDKIRDEIMENPLSILIRSGWHEVGEPLQEAEFEVLLCTGGPSVRIMGELDEHCQPSFAWMEYQGWGTPWRQYFDAKQDVLLEYCSNLYFRE